MLISKGGTIGDGDRYKYHLAGYAKSKGKKQAATKADKEVNKLLKAKDKPLRN